MPSPSSSLSTLRPELAGSLEEFDLAMDRQGFIGARVLPILSVDKGSGPFGKIPVEQLLQNRETARAPGSGYSRGIWKFETDSFAVEEHGAEEPIDDREAQLYRDFFDAEIVAAERARDVVLRNAEKRIAAAIFNTTTWTGVSLTTAVSTEWSNASSGVPITDVNAARQKVWDGCGLWPNALIINRRVFNNLRVNAQVKDAIASSGAGFATRARDITVQQLAEVFDLDYILVAGSAKNTANEGQAAAFSEIWDKEYAMVCRIATSNDIKEPCLGRTFMWMEGGSAPDNGMELPAIVETYRDETVRSDIVRVRHDAHEKVLYAACGHLLSNITA